MGAFSRPRTATLASVSSDPSNLPVTTLSTLLKETSYDSYLTLFPIEVSAAVRRRVDFSVAPRKIATKI